MPGPFGIKSQNLCRTSGGARPSPGPAALALRRFYDRLVEPDDTAVPAQLMAVSAALRMKLPELCQAVTDSILEQIEPLSQDQAIIDLLTVSVESNVTTLVHIIGYQIDSHQADAPPAALAYARRLAQRGVPVGELLRAYRVGQACFMQWCYRELAAQARDLPTAFAAAMRLTETTFGYIDRVSEHVLTAYVRERDEWVRSTVAVRAAQVRSLLAGGPIEVNRVEPALGYRLRQHHLGIVAWVEEAARTEGTLVELERMAGRLADHLSKGARALFVSRDESSAFMWLPSLTASSRSVVNAPRISRFPATRRPQPPPAQDGNGQQRAAVDVGEVRVAREPVITGGIGHDQRLARPLSVAQHRHRHSALVAAAADRDGAAAGCGQQPVVPVLAPQRQVHAGGAGHRAEHLHHPGVQTADAGLRAQRLRRRQDPEQVDGPGRDRGAAIGKISGLAATVPGVRTRWRAQGRVGPVQLGGLGDRAPRQVLLAGLGEQAVADMVEAVFEVEASGVFGYQGLVPGPLPPGGLAERGVEGQGGGTEVPGRPGPLGLGQPQQVQEVVRRVRGADGQPACHLVQLGQQRAALVTVRGTGLPGQGQPAQQAGHGVRVEVQDGRQQRHRRRGVLRQPGRIAEDGRPSRAR